MSRNVAVVCGVIAIVTALAGGIVAALGVSRLPEVGTEGRPLFIVARGLSLAAKLGLLVTGVMLVRGSKGALPAVIVTLVLSLAHSMVQCVVLPPIPEGLSQAGRVGRHVGRTLGLWGPPVLYVALIAVLIRARHRTPGPSGER
jgi:hypothetical protein